MTYAHIKLPAGGEKITVQDAKLGVPDHPVAGYVEGDGTGHDITRAGPGFGATGGP